MTEVPEKRDDSEDTAKQWDWKDSLPLLATVLTVFFISMRLLSISKYNAETANGILQASGTATIIVATLIPVAGLVAGLSIMLLATALAGRRPKGPVRQFAVILIVFLAAASIFISPILVMAYDGIFFVFLIPFFRLRRHSRQNNDGRVSLGPFMLGRVGTYFLIVTVIGMVVTLAVNSTPWVPAEAIVTTTDTHPLIGYVVGETDTDVTILMSSTDLIVHLSPPEISSRTVCRISKGSIAWFLETIPTLVSTGNSTYPICSDIAHQHSG